VLQRQVRCRKATLHSSWLLEGMLAGAMYARLALRELSQPESHSLDGCWGAYIELQFTSVSQPPDSTASLIAAVMYMFFLLSPHNGTQLTISHCVSADV